MPQHVIRTTIEASAGAGSAFVATGGLSPNPCAPANFSDYPLYEGVHYFFTIANLVQLLGAVATAITIVYFARKLMGK